MAYSNLSATLTAEQKAAALTSISEIKEALSFLINLTNQERKKLRKVGPKRVGYVNDVRKATKANASAIPSVVDLAGYEKDAQLFGDLSEIYAELQPLFEGLNDTIMASGSESIQVSDQCYAYLKTAARGNANVKMAIADIARHFKGQGKKKEEVVTK